MKARRWFSGFSALVIAMHWQARALAAETAVDLELVLAVDVSLSMDYDEQRLQRDGYAAAFAHAEVIQAIRLGGWGKIAVTYIEWAGVGLSRIIVPWTLIDGTKTATAFAARLSASQPSHMFRTSISHGLTYSATLFADNGFKGLRRVIDISGDGPNNQGMMVTRARDQVVAQGITINGLPVMLKRGQSYGIFDLENLDVYYQDCVIGGFGAFIVSVQKKSEFAIAIRRKLVLEIASPIPRVIPAQIQRRRPRIDCLIGEKAWRKWRGGGDAF